MPCDTAGLGSSPFARRYLGNRYYFLFLRVLRCFSSPRLPSTELCIHSVITGLYSCWVSPFGDPRVNGYLPLAVAYRSLSRPSSPPRAKASPMRPSIIPLFLDVSKYIVTGVISDTLPKPFLYHQQADGARCILFEFLLCLLADSGFLSLASIMSMCSFRSPP